MNAENKNDETIVMLLDEINKRLKKGDIIEVSNLTGVPHMTAFNHIKGRVKYPNVTLLEAAIDVIEKREKIEETEKNAFSELLKKFRDAAEDTNN